MFYVFFGRLCSEGAPVLIEIVLGVAFRMVSFMFDSRRWDDPRARSKPPSPDVQRPLSRPLPAGTRG